MKSKEEIAQSLRDAEADAAALLAGDLLKPISDVAENAHGFAEAMTEKYRGGHPEQTHCDRGCSWCCYQSVAVRAPEAFRIANFIRSQPEEEQRRLEKRIEQLDQITRGMLASHRHKVQKPCAFLEDGKCSVYAARPLACAEFTSRNELECKRGKRIGFRANGIIHEASRMLVFGAVSQGMADGLQSALPNSDSGPLELVAAVHDVLTGVVTEAQWRNTSKSFSRAAIR
jgi:Fe-S-cluster containining protein